MRNQIITCSLAAIGLSVATGSLLAEEAPDCTPFSPTDLPCFRGPWQNGTVLVGDNELVDDLKDAKLPAFGGETFISPTYADGRLYTRGTIPGSGKWTPAQRIAKGLPPEHGCVYCFDLRKNVKE
jgi:hypothetical protein